MFEIWFWIYLSSNVLICILSTIDNPFPSFIKLHQLENELLDGVFDFKPAKGCLIVEFLTQHFEWGNIFMIVYNMYNQNTIIIEIILFK